MKTRTLLSIVVAFAWPGVSMAQAPAEIPIQGFLTDAAGAPVETEVEMKVAIYEAEEAGDPLYGETQRITPRGGSFVLYLGRSGALDLRMFAEGRGRFVGIAVGGDAEMRPRLALGSAPYAAAAEVASDAMTLAGRDSSSFADASHGHPWSEISDVPAFAPASHRHGWSEISDIPSDLADGDDVCAPGFGLLLAGPSQLGVDDAVVQRRIGSCAPGSAIRAVGVDGTPTCEADDDSVYTDASAVAAVQAADTFVRNTGDTINGDLVVSDDAVVTDSLTVGRLSFSGSSQPVRIIKMEIWRESSGGTNPGRLHFEDATGVDRTLDLGATDGTANLDSSHIAYRPGVGGADGALYFNIEASPTISCTLLHNDDDAPRPGFYFATDGGNNSEPIWGNATTQTFVLRREGATTSPILTAAGFAILCF